MIRRLSFVLLTLTWLLSSPPARADDPAPSPGEHPSRPAAPPAEDAAEDEATAQARDRYRRGLELYDEGDFGLALVEFERAYSIHPSYKLLYNIGQVHYQLAHYAKARIALERYLHEGAAEITGARRAAVEKDLAALRMRTATLTVRTIPPGADVAVDDVDVGKAPLERVLVNAGLLRVRGSCAACVTRVREIALAGDDVRTLELDLTQDADAKAAATPDRGRPLSRAGIGWIVTGVLGAGALGTGIATAISSSKYESARLAPISGTPQDAAADLDRRRSTVQALAIITDVLAGATLAAAGVSLYFTLHDRPTAAGSRAAPSGASLGLAVGF